MKDLIVDTEIHGMSIESPLVYARQLAQAELHSEVTAEERGWLANNPLLWLRALRGLREETDAAIDRDREKFKAEWPEPMRTGSEYYAVQVRRASANARRRHFLKHVNQRLGELRVTLGRELAAAPLVGEVVDMFVHVVDLIDAGDVDGARLSALRRAEHLARVYGLSEAPDNSAASPVGLILPAPNWDGEFYCRGCRSAPLGLESTTCPRCGQRHDVSFSNS